MFLGSYKSSLDRKSRRVALPKKIRENISSNEIILSYGYEKCIFGFDPKTWQKESDRQLEKPLTDQDARRTRRFLFASAELVKLDDQGRVVISSSLLQFAQIKSPIIIGAGDHFEIWDIGDWDSYRMRLEKAPK